MLEGQVVGFPLVEILLLVVGMGDFRVPQAKIAREVLEVELVVLGHVVGVGELAAARLCLDGVVHTHGAVGLVLLDEPVDAVELPVGRLAVPAAVEPDFADVAVLREQFCELATHIINVLAEVLVAIAGIVAVQSE